MYVQSFLVLIELYRSCYNVANSLGDFRCEVMFRGSQQETLDLSLVLFGTRQRGVHVILRGMILPVRLNPGYLQPRSYIRITSSLILQNIYT